MSIRTVPRKSFSRRQRSRACRPVATGSGQGQDCRRFSLHATSLAVCFRSFAKRFFISKRSVVAKLNQQRTHVGEYVMRLDIDGFGKSRRHRLGGARVIILACR